MNVASAGNAEVKPLVEIADTIDSLTRMADELEAFLTRFNGPRLPEPKETASLNASSVGYRGEIARLDQIAHRLGSITDLIIRIG